MTDATLGLLRRAAAGILIAAAFTAAACDESLKDVVGPTPNLEPTFASVRNEIFSTTDLAGRTACVNCHNPQRSRFTAGLDLQTDPYAALVNVPSRQRQGAVLVIPGDPENSYLIRKLEGRDITSARMPQNGPPYLTAGQILVIRRWIAIGAPNN
jgi:hypothetical protein